MADRATLKQRAKDQLGNKIFGNRWLKMLLIWLVYDVIISILSGTGFRSYDFNNGAMKTGIIVFSGIFTLATLIISGPLKYGMIRTTVRCARENKEAEFDEFGAGFKECMSDAILLEIMTAIFTFLWTLLFIIPGIIKAYSYSMAIYIQQDQENKDWSFCLNKSKEMTKGHKWDLFVLDLSFIGWYIVGLLCLGIGVYWVVPYYQMTKANFYIELKKELDPEPEFVEEEDGDVIDGDIFEEDK